MVTAISPGTRAFSTTTLYEQKVLSPYFVLSKINMYSSKPNIPEKNITTRKHETEATRKNFSP